MTILKSEIFGIMKQETQNGCNPRKAINYYFKQREKTQKQHSDLLMQAVYGIINTTDLKDSLNFVQCWSMNATM